MLKLVRAFKVSSREAHVLEFLLERAKGRCVSGVTCGEIAGVLGVSVPTVRRDLARLEARGLIKKRLIRTADGKTKLNILLKDDLLKFVKGSVDDRQQQQIGNIDEGDQNDRRKGNTLITEEERRALELIVKRTSGLTRIPLHKAVFFLINSPLPEEETLELIVRADTDPSVKNPVGFLLVCLGISKENARRWEWLVSHDDLVPEGLRSLYEELLKERERERLEEEVKAIAKASGLSLPDVKHYTPEELKDLKKKLIVEAGTKILSERPDLKRKLRKVYEGVKSMPVSSEEKKLLFFSFVLEKVAGLRL